MKKILIIDDEQDLCLLLKTYLVPLQYDVHLAFTLKEGIQKIESISPDIVFLDNNLPDGIGWDKVNYIRTRLPDTTINLMSAYRGFPEELHSDTAIKFLEKPISLVALRRFL
ncbi:MAG TPA: response regulator [Ohtaekwangia sp.]|uniref:response regulator n=1 Tax=Ohtaekwangia sp. TaxID=2066019 RepID=UPI002F9384AF